MASPNIKQRVALLEAEVAELKRQLHDKPDPNSPWWDKVWGAFQGDPAFLEAMRLGQEWRKRENAKSLAKKRKNARS